jgi:DNA-binding NtrC family response regulator
MAHLLIADDNEGIRELYALEFESRGHTVTTAADGEQALALCRAQRFDAVILDIGMPEKSGLEVLGDIAVCHGGTPVIVNTAYPMFKMDFRALRASAWLTKSSKLEGLFDAVDKVLQGPRKAPGGQGDDNP